MFAKLEMRFENGEELNFHMASLFHGALMELISPDYAFELHSSTLHPYTQHLERRKDGWYWVVTVLNERAATEIFDHTLQPLSEIEIKKHGLHLKITSKQYTELSDRELMYSFYQEQADRLLTLQFVTATSFKLNGEYLNYPDLASIYGNLMKKYDLVSRNESMRDEDTLNELCTNTSIYRYDLKSTLFHLEGIKVPAFVGTVTLRFKGTQTMANFARLLFRFSEYSGIGIKTALGMGAVRIREEGRKTGREGATDQTDHRQPSA